MGVSKAVDEKLGSATRTQPSDGKSARGRARREMILAAAAELFGRGGFHATSIDDIGEAVGITGPGLYRYFDSKHHVLAALMDGAISRHEEIVAEVRDELSASIDQLSALISRAAQAVVANRDIAGIFFQEMRNLAPDDRVRLARKQRLVITEWVHLLLQVRPDLSDEEARIAVQAAGGLLNSVVNFNTSMPLEKLADLLTTMALGSLFSAYKSPKIGAERA